MGLHHRTKRGDKKIVTFHGKMCIIVVRLGRLAFFSGVLCRGIVIINLGMPNIIIVLNIIMQRITLLLRICIYTALHPGHRQREMLLEEPSLSPCLYNKSSSIRRS